MNRVEIDVDGLEDWIRTLEVVRSEAVVHDAVRERLAKSDQKGGPGSGHWGHAGRPGERGGSLAGSGGLAAEKQTTGGPSEPEDLYRRRVIGYCQALWRGDISKFEFVEAFSSSIQSAFAAAWAEGMEHCGVEFIDRTEEERDALQVRTNEEYTYLPGFATFIQEHSRADGFKFHATIGARAALWYNRYRDVRMQAMQMACRDKKLRWVLNPLKESCHDCLAYDGRVYRASTWRKYDIRPKHPDLECHGFECGCRFEVTDDPCTPGRPPEMIGRRQR